jgi:signal transduction histidine kinase
MTALEPDTGEREPVPPRGWMPDAAVGVVLALFFTLVAAHIGTESGRRAMDWFGYLLLVVGAAAVGLCRRRPRVALGLAVVAIGVYLGRGYSDNPVYVSGWISLLALSYRTDRRTAVIGAVVLIAALAVAGTFAGPAYDEFSLLTAIFIGWSVAAVAIGDALRNRRAYLSGLRERARDLELTRTEEVRRRIAEDRLRIARDLHDSVGHAMATINVQAAAGAHVADRDPAAAKQALAVIARASGDVLEELTAMLAVLRDDAEAADRSPAPGLGQIPQLVEATKSAGLRASLVVEGPVGTVAGPVGTAAYRIVQESLTNVIRHAKATSAEVVVRAGEDRGLEVAVHDDGVGHGHGQGHGHGHGHAHAPSGTGEAVGGVGGVGIQGMRERAESTGGRLETGPGADGGFVVRARWAGRP